ncbi:hypothetical protein Trydic_g23474 [Trypoxylus dichotomus]
MALSQKTTPNNLFEHSGLNTKSLLLKPLTKTPPSSPRSWWLSTSQLRRFWWYLSDSMSVLHGLKNCLLGIICTNNLLWEIKAMIHEMHTDTSIFCGNPIMKESTQNEKGDQLARLNRHLEPSLIQLDPRNFFNTFKKQMFLEWQSW